MDTASDPEAAMMNAPGSKEREETWISWNAPRSATSMNPDCGPEEPLVSVPQENLPVVESQRSLEEPATSQSERPEPYVVLADAYPVIQRFPDTLALPPKLDLPSTSRRPVIKRSLEPVRNPEVVVLVPNLE